MNAKFKLAMGAAAVAFVASTSVNAGVVRVTEADFTADAGLITFSEFALGTVNPVYAPADYAGEVGGVTVTFGGYFLGQYIGTPGVDCPAGAAASGCIGGTPTGTLSLDAASPSTFIVGDGAAPNSPVLSGTPTFNGVISMVFDQDIAGVGLDGGYFDAIGGTAITAFDRAGNIIGQVLNEGLGIEFLGLVSDLGNEIAGLQFSLVGGEPAGFAIDSLRFGFADQVTNPNDVPAPASLALFGAALAGLGLARRKAAKA